MLMQSFNITLIHKKITSSHIFSQIGFYIVIKKWERKRNRKQGNQIEAGENLFQVFPSSFHDVAPHHFSSLTTQKRNKC